MSPEAILQRLGELGVTVRLASPGTIGLAPGGRTPPDLREEILAHKPELLALLERRERTWTQDPARMPWHTRPGEDPRPDLDGSERWQALLLLASGDASDPHGTYGRLLAARACGAVVERRDGRWKLIPIIDPSERLSVWADEAAWQADVERWLRPSAREIVGLLRQLPPPEEAASG